MRQGADVDALRLLAAALEDSGGRLAALHAELSGAIASVMWRGGDADRFRSEWAAQQGSAAAVARRLVAAGAGVRVDADQQALVSSPSSISVGSSSGLTALVDAPRRLLDPAPARVRWYDVEIEGVAGVAASAGVELRVEELADGRSRIVETASAGLGAGRDGGGTFGVALGDRGWAIGGDGEAAISGTVFGETTWIVPTSDVDAFVAHRAAELAVGEGETAAAQGALRAVPFLGFVAGAVGAGPILDTLSYRPPAPVSRGLAVGIDGRAAAVGSGATASAGASLSSAVVAGATVDRRTGVTTARLAGEFAGALSATGLGRSLDGGAATAASLTIDASGRPTMLLLESTSTSTSSTVDVRTRVAVDLAAPAVRNRAEAFLAHVRSGRIDDAAAVLEELGHIGLLDSEVSVDRYAELESRRYGIDVPLGSAGVTYREVALRR